MRRAQRASAGDVLAALGDPRFDPDRFHLPADDLLGFVHIPADPRFRIGTRKADAKKVSEIVGYEVPDDEINDAVTPTPDFYISRYPVTVAQFRAFAEATGLEVGDARALRDPDSRPVRYVSWHEALAYSNWLHEMLATAPALEGIEAARLVRAGAWQVEPAERAGVGEGGPRRSSGHRLLLGRHPRCESRQLRRLRDRGYLGGWLLPGQRLRTVRHDRQRVGMDAQPI